MRRLTPALLTPLILAITLAGYQGAPLSSTAAAEDAVVLVASVSPATQGPLEVAASGTSAATPSAPTVATTPHPILSSRVWAARGRQAESLQVSKAAATVLKAPLLATAAGLAVVAV